jgi:hypothetical protein
LKHFAHSTKGRHFEKDKLGFIRQSLIFYFVAINRRKGEPKPILARAQAPASNKMQILLLIGITQEAVMSVMEVACPAYDNESHY